MAPAPAAAASKTSRSSSVRRLPLPPSSSPSRPWACSACPPCAPAPGDATMAPLHSSHKSIRVLGDAAGAGTAPFPTPAPSCGPAHSHTDRCRARTQDPRRSSRRISRLEGCWVSVGWRWRGMAAGDSGGVGVVERAAQVKSPPPGVRGWGCSVGGSGEIEEEDEDEDRVGWVWGVHGVMAPSQTRLWQCARRAYSAFGVLGKGRVG